MLIVCCRVIREFLGSKAFPRPQINLGLDTWQLLLHKGLGVSVPHFDPYRYDLDWLIGAYALPYVGLTAYVGFPETTTPEGTSVRHTAQHSTAL